MTDSNSCKIFVGNVPFECNIEEFQKCFATIKGFIKAEIIFKTGTFISRGFGFILFDNKENAQKMINRTDIFFKNRCLRFTEYTFDDKKGGYPHVQYVDDNISIHDHKNYISIKGLSKDFTREDLKNIFSNYGPIGRYFIVTDNATGESKGYGIVEIIDKTNFDKLLQDKFIVHDSIVYELSKWKLHKFNQGEKKITKNDLHQAFIAGRNIGIIEALRTTKIKNNASISFI